MPVTIIDGLILGEEPISRDKVYMENHKVSRIINCAGRDLRNFFESEKLYIYIYSVDIKLFSGPTRQGIL